MAEVIPFRGILYNPGKINDMADVVTPPYDVISVQERNNYHEASPYNIIRLILGKTDFDSTGFHAKAADYFQKWLGNEILVQDQEPAFYVTAIEFSLEDKAVTRYGLTAAVRLEPFDKGIILPHEKTFSKVKSERLGLLKKCHANFSPIFSLYTDPQNNILDIIKNSVANKSPDINLIDDKGSKQKLWRITDKRVHAYITEAMRNKKIFIADGHHRYETALNYKNLVSSDNPDFNSNHPANFIMMYLCSMEDPGLIILPAHRILTGLTDQELTSFIKKCGDYFDITSIPFSKNENEKAKHNFISALKANSDANTIGVFMKNCLKLFILTLKPQVMETIFADEIHVAIRSLDVTVLTNLILTKILGFDQARMDNEKIFSYTTDYSKAIDAVRSGSADITFILNPTFINQVKKIAENGLVMPRKSTYFYPKVLTGQVLNLLRKQV